MAFSAMSYFVFGETVTASRINQFIDNDNALRDGSGLNLGAGTVNVSALTTGAWTAGTPAATGFSAKTTDLLKYVKIGRLVLCYVEINGTSNGTGLTFTLPYAAAANTNRAGFKTANNGAGLDTDGQLTLTASSTTATAGPTHTTNTWTNTNAKFFIGNFFYESTS